ncbi:MAG: sigma-54-dependent transcriptional regulator [Candidatus Methylomirabilales bacterium]
MKDRRVLVVEADPGVQRHLTGLLHAWGYTPVVATSVEEALAAVAHTKFLLSLVGMELDGSDGLDFLRRLKIQGGDPGAIIMFCDVTDLKRVEAATILGADDVLQKPIKTEELENAIKAGLFRPHPVWGQPPADDPTARLQQETALWRSPRMQEVWKIIQQAARVDVTVLVRGQTGTGKDLAARAIHYLSPRQGRPFVKVNCAAVPRELLESELFGHERGAFTGAHQLKIGKFESANHGTVFLDEIGDLHPALQAKLLHVLQDGEFSRVGGKSTIKVDVRIIAATNQDLEKAVGTGRFRDDLYYRLNVIQIVVPPLSERPDEIPLLVNYFIDRYSRQFHREGFIVPRSVMERLVQHSYPGNIRELENIVKRMIVLNDPFVLKTLPPLVKAGDDGDGTPGPPETHTLPLKEIARKAARAAEREAIAVMLEQTGWNRVRAAKLLKISYRALLYKIKETGLKHGSGAAPPALT